MLISDRIAALILSMLKEHGGALEIRRNDMAERIGCSPSQINYVISSRFSAERGYIVESRRGGGGYIRIVEKRFTGGKERLMHAFASVGESITPREALAVVSALSEFGALSEESAAPMRAALCSPMLAELAESDCGRRLTAELLRRMLLSGS